MKKNKMWATGLAAVFLSTTLLSGAASAETTPTTPATTTKADSDEVSALKKEIEKSNGVYNGKYVSDATKAELKTLIDNSNELLKKAGVTVKEITDQTKALNTVRLKASGEDNKGVVDAKNTAKDQLNAQIDRYKNVDKKGASAGIVKTLETARSEAGKVLIDFSATAEKINTAATQLKTAIEKFEADKLAENAVGQAKAELESALKDANKAKTSAAADKVDATNADTLTAAIKDADELLKGKVSTKEQYDAAKTKLTTATQTVVDELAKKADVVKTIKATLDAANAIKTDNKPADRVETLTKEIATLKTIGDKPENYTKATIEKAIKETKNAGDVVNGSSDILKVNAGSDQKLTVNFKTADGQTEFPKSANKTTSTGTISSKKTYFEFYLAKDGITDNGPATLQTLVNDYDLTLPTGFELAEPTKLIKSTDDVTNIVLKEKGDATFNQAYVTFKFLLNGKEVSAAGDAATFSSLQLTGDSINVNDVIDEIKSKGNYADFKKYFYKSGYTVDKNDKTFTFSNNDYHQTKTINFVKKPDAKKYVTIPENVTYLSTSESNYLKAGYKYNVKTSLPSKLYIYSNGNRLLSHADYKITITKIYKDKDKNKTNLIKSDGTVILPEAYVNYRVNVKLEPKEGYYFKGAKYLNYPTVLYTYDSEPVISGVKNSTYVKGKFSYTKGITAYDYVDKKNVKVTYKGKVNPAKKGAYKIYYYAKDSKGNTAKKTRTVTVK